MRLKRQVWVGIGAVAISGVGILLAVGRLGQGGVQGDLDRDKVSWRAALAYYPERYAGLDSGRMSETKKLEAKYRELMDALTVIDGRGFDHGQFHETKRERERELWALMKEVPAYPAAPRLILASIDDVYLGYHSNGWWGPWWHWPI